MPSGSEFNDPLPAATLMYGNSSVQRASLAKRDSGHPSAWYSVSSFPDILSNSDEACRIPQVGQGRR